MSAEIDSYSNPSSPIQESIRHQASDLVIKYLQQIGVEYVFGVPGGAIEPLYNALARSERQGGPRPVLARHESGAAFMADGYTRETGKLGVCCATTGPGTTNLVTGVASAYENHIPMLVLTAQTALPTFGKGAFQESSSNSIDTVGILEHCTYYNSLVSHIDQLEPKLVSAISTSLVMAKGPVHLSLPPDILSQSISSELSYDLNSLLEDPSIIDFDAVNTLHKLVNESNNIIIVIGAGCAEAIGIILEFALLAQALIVTTPHGKGLVSSYHPLYRGVFGFAGHSSAAQLLKDDSVDLVLAIGTSMGEWETNGWDKQALLNKKLVHIDAQESHFMRTPMARLHVRGRVLTIFEQLLLKYYQEKYTGNRKPDRPKKYSTNIIRIEKVSKLGTRQSRLSFALPFKLDEEQKYHDDSVPIKPQRLMQTLAALFPANTRYLADTGNSFAWATHYLHPFDQRISGRRKTRSGGLRVTMEFGAMGWAIGAATGTAMGCPGAPVVCITGDGSFLMNGQEITVAAYEKLPVIYVILNDSALGMVKHGQRLTGAEATSFELPNINYCEMAKAMGISAYSITCADDLIALDIDSICKHDGPTLLDVHVDPGEVPPMKTRIKVLGSTA